MAKHTGRRKSYKGRITNTLTVGALAPAVVKEATIGSALESEIYISSCKFTWSRKDGTAGEGPIICGVADIDLSAAEIEECLEASTSFSVNDRIAREQATRPVRIVGTFNGATAFETLNDGNPIFTRCGFHAVDGDAPMQIWAYNKDSATLTTGSFLVVVGDVYFRPV